LRTLSIDAMAKLSEATARQSIEPSVGPHLADGGVD